MCVVDRVGIFCSTAALVCMLDTLPNFLCLSNMHQQEEVLTATRLDR
jgi:hypothetical protein